MPKLKDDLTSGHANYGALLAAVGNVMMRNGVSAIAARSGQYDEQLVNHMVREYGLDGKDAEAMLEVELSEAINLQ